MLTRKERRFKEVHIDQDLEVKVFKNAGDEHTAGEYVRRVLGEEFEVPEKQGDAGENKFRRTSKKRY